MKKVIAYVRISTGKQKNNTSIEKQIKVIKEYCVAHGYELVAIYSEEGSAKNIKGRPEFIKMFNQFIADNEVEYVIVYKLDRAFRKLLDSLIFWDRLEQNNKYFISILDNINTMFPHSKDTYIFSSLHAEKERENTLQRTYSGMEAKAEKGYFNGGIVLGYESVSKKLRILPEEAAIVEFIYNKYVYDNWGYKKIASELNIQGIKTKKGKEWTTTAVKTVLENKIYIGYMKWKNTYTKGVHESIISQSLWDKAQEIKSKKSFQPRKLHPGTYPLSGLLKCPQCGSVMVQGNSSPKYKYYQCNKNKTSGRSACTSNLIKKDYAEEYVLEEVVSYLKNLNLSTLLHQITISNLNSNLVSLKQEATILQKSLERVESKLSDLFALLYSDNEEEKISMETFKLLVREAEKEKEKSQQKLDELNYRIALQKDLNLSNNIDYIVNDFKSFYNIISDQDKKLLFHNFIKEVHVTKGNTAKERKIKDIIYHFDIDNINNILSS